MENISKTPVWKKVLVLSRKPASRGRIQRCFKAWREDAGIPRRCDNAVCNFHTRPLEWNGMQLPLILDHKDGNKLNNQPSNLRYLCPNCDSQLPTRGGANRGRVVFSDDDGYILKNRDGSTIAGATARMHGTSALHAEGIAKHDESVASPQDETKS